MTVKSLSGHSDMSEYALSWSKQIPRLISGGSDHVVCMWDLRDAETAGLFQTSLSSSLFHSKVGSSDTAWAKSKTLDAKRKFRGHNDVVEDVAYHPTDAGANLFASVSDDRSLIVWDARLAGDKHGDGVAARLEEAHSDDMNCVDWNSHDVNQIVTGSSDGTIHIYDYRMLASHGRRSIVRRYGRRIDASSTDGGSGSDETAQSRYKLGNITNVMWSPTDGRFFASSGDDGAVTIWDASKSGAPLEQDGLPEALLFRHAGHRASIVDFDWNAQSAWTIASLSDDSENPRLAGGTLQVWRITDLLYKGLQEDTKATSEWIDSLGAALSKAEKEDAEKKAGAKNAKQQIVRRDGD